MSQKNIPFSKDAFPERKKELKEALKDIDEADALIEIDDNYTEALNHYLKAYRFNNSNAELNYKIGKCYIEAANVDRTAATEYLEKAKSLDPDSHHELYKYLGDAYHYNYEWDKAIASYTKYKNIANNRREMLLADKKIGECNNGKKLSREPQRVFIDNIGNIVNTDYPEYIPVISTDESVMYFTSKRDDSMGGEIDPHDGHYMEDIYVSQKGSNGKWGTPTNVGKPINSDKNDATVALSPDGASLLIFEEGDIFECKLQGEEWSKPKKLSKSINTNSTETSASYSFDGRTLYFVSDREDLSIGGKDIYYSHMDEDGEWGEPKNLGTTINTIYNEESVFIHPDGKTLFFSSMGHNSIGGYDIYKSTKIGEKWTEPINMGLPINTPDDDIFFVVNASGKHGYYSSGRKGGYGEQDIYLVTILGPEKPLVLNTEDNLIASIAEPLGESVIEPTVEVTTNQLTIFKGTTLDSISKKYVTAEITITDNENGLVINTLQSNSATGKFLLTLPSGANYGIAVKAQGYLFHSENFDLPPGGDFQMVEKDILLKKIEIGNKIILKNIFFDLDKATLRAESETELKNLQKLLTENPSLKIEISGHTDNQGSDAYNQSLSEKRAKAVVDYLAKAGVAKGRLTFKGYGESQPISSNKTAEGRQLNRRTEFKVIAK